jgi:hypothetical protein
MSNIGLSRKMMVMTVNNGEWRKRCFDSIIGMGSS